MFDQALLVTAAGLLLLVIINWGRTLMLFLPPKVVYETQQSHQCFQCRAHEFTPRILTFCFQAVVFLFKLKRFFIVKFV